ncbi:SNF2 family N-terminal domain-containing protein [Gongronella butleri]|nr:SNF2 family N-terminal domain-containing protein [Gongronella butleri]
MDTDTQIEQVTADTKAVALTSDTDSPMEPVDSPTTTESPAIESPAEQDAQDAPLVTEAMVKEEEAMAEATKRDYEKQMQREAQLQFDTTVKAQRMKRLHFLLEKSSAYANILGQRLAKQQEEARERAIRAEHASESKAEGKDAGKETSKEQGKKARAKDEPARNVTKRRKIKDDKYQLEEYLDQDDLKRHQTDSSVQAALQQEKQQEQQEQQEQQQGDEKEKKDTTARLIKPTASARQPRLVTGGVLRDYQLAGVEWLISLWENGLNGILADEMGLGKTLQTISFIAHLKGMNVAGPYLVVAPLSTLANWVNEFKRFTPTIPVVLYHGSKDERQHLVNKKLKPKNQYTLNFPIVITSYQLIINDRKVLQRYNWKYIVVDEAHRLKNMECRLIRELKMFSSANRLLLTGTPLQNNLAELWSLLNYLLPDIFDSLDMFESWFNFSDINEKSGQERILKEEQEDQIITSLHGILKPFLLRRLKTDVEHSLPKKKEYLLYAPLTAPQKNLYDALIKHRIRDFLIKRKTNTDTAADENEPVMTVPKDSQPADTDNDKANQQRKSNRALKTVSYKEETDNAFFRAVEKGTYNPKPIEDHVAEKEKAEVKSAIRQVNSLHLQNLVMQLRKVCNHPFLFDWPLDPETKMPVLNNELAAQSGKMLLLDRLLPALFERGHKVLIFSQMTKMLDILEDWTVELKGWPVCRIDGGVSQESRREQIDAFNAPNSKYNLFLLSTRAGGLGINLTSADTVIIYDSDWNPQMDLQAQDRVHRIGQKRPVLIYRLVTGNTVESKLLDRATAKRRLEKLVISKGKFKTPVGATGKTDSELNARELAEILASEDGEEVQLAAQGDKVISDEDLEAILDRSEHVFDTENKSSSGRFREIDTAEMHDGKNEVLATRA